MKADRFKYVSIFVVNGLLPGYCPKQIFEDVLHGYRVIVGLDDLPVQILKEIFRQRSIISNIRLINSGDYRASELEKEISNDIESNISEIKINCDGKVSGYLIIEGEKQNEEIFEADSYGDAKIVCDLECKRKLVKVVDQIENKALVGLSCMRNYPTEIVPLDSDWLFYDEKGTPIYRYFRNISITTTVVGAVDQQQIESYSHIMRDEKVPSAVYSNFVESLSDSNTLFERFIFAWNALEILVNKKYREEEIAIRDTIFRHGVSAEVDDYLKRVHELMSERNRLLDRYILLASVHFKDSMTQLCEKFKEYKKLRDRMLHGEDFNEEQLPVKSIIEFLSYHIRKFSNMPSA